MKGHPILGEHRDHVRKRLGRKDITIPSVTLAIQPFDAAVKGHFDGQNPHHLLLRQVMAVSKICADRDGGLWRVSLICKFRQAIVEALDRIRDSKKVCRDVVIFLSECARYRHPDVDVPDWFWHGAGDRGVFVSVRRR